MNRLVTISLTAILLVPLASAAGPVNWDEVLGEPQGRIPEALPKVTWRDNLLKAFDEAKQTNRPVFVTLRCLPCKQCSAFDKDVLEGGEELSPLLAQFITVRLTDAKAMDMRLLPFEGFQDLDLSWWGYFLSPEGRVYGIFGGKDHVSDATRISVAALANTMKRVLAHHYDPRRAGWNVDGPATKMGGAAMPPTELPGYRPWIDKAHKEVKNSACLHCHQVAEVLREPALLAGNFDKQRDTQVWPLPENVGIELDRDHGLLVKAVLPESPAAKAGLRAGDVLGAAQDRKLFGQADFRGVLHRGPKGAGSIPVWYLRDGKVIYAELDVADGWRKTVLDWRMSISQGNIGPDAGFFPLNTGDGERKKLGIGKEQMAVKPYMYGEPTAASKAGLRGSHVVTAVNGKSPAVHGRAFQWWFRQQFNPGDTVTLTVMEGPGRSREITFTLPTK